MILVSISAHKNESGNLFNDLRNESAHRKKSRNLFNDLHISVPIQKSLQTYLMILVSISANTKKFVN